MSEIRLKYLHSFCDRHGHFYFRYRGNRWPLPAPHEEGFATAYDALLARIKANAAGPKNVAFLPGSLGWVIERFLASQAFENRARATKKNYRRILDQLRERYGAGMLRDLKPRHVKVIRNEMRDASTTTGADIALSLISILWNFAEELGLELDANPTRGVRRVHKGMREHEPWPQELLEAFMLRATPALRWAVNLALFTGQRRSDLVKMRWDQFDGEFIEVRQQKTGELLSIPCHKALRAQLQVMPRQADTILVGERGKPLKPDSLTLNVSRMLRAMGVTGYSIHGLRKNASRALAEAGCGDREIMAITENGAKVALHRAR
jgi:integrase